MKTLSNYQENSIAKEELIVVKFDLVSGLKNQIIKPKQKIVATCGHSWIENGETSEFEVTKVIKRANVPIHINLLGWKKIKAACQNIMPGIINTISSQVNTIFGYKYRIVIINGKENLSDNHFQYLVNEIANQLSKLISITIIPDNTVKFNTNVRHLVIKFNGD